MSIDSFTVASELTVLAAARDPSVQPYSAANGLQNLPTSAADGAGTQDGVAACCIVGLREQVHRRTVRLTVTTLDPTDTAWDYIIDGNSGTYDPSGAADTELDTIVAEFAAAINADSSVNGIVTATAVRANDDDVTVGVRDSVKITGDGEDDYSVSIIATGGASVLVLTGDAVGAAFRDYRVRKNATGATANTEWYRGHLDIDVPKEGWTDVLPVGSTARLYFHLYDLRDHVSDGAEMVIRDPDIEICPGVLES